MMRQLANSCFTMQHISGNFGFLRASAIFPTARVHAGVGCAWVVNGRGWFTLVGPIGNSGSMNVSYTCMEGKGTQLREAGYGCHVEGEQQQTFDPTELQRVVPSPQVVHHVWQSELQSSRAHRWKTRFKPEPILGLVKVAVCSQMPTFTKSTICVWIWTFSPSLHPHVCGAWRRGIEVLGPTARILSGELLWMWKRKSPIWQRVT